MRRAATIVCLVVSMSVAVGCGRYGPPERIAAPDDANVEETSEESEDEVQP